MSDEKKIVKLRVSDDDFVIACRDSISNSEAAEKTGLTKASVQARLAKLRKKGLDFPKYARVAKQATDIEKLNELLKQKVQ
jgi:transposase